MGIWKENNVNRIKCDECGEEDALVTGDKSILKQIMRKYGWLITKNEKVYCSVCRMDVEE